MPPRHGCPLLSERALIRPQPVRVEHASAPLERYCKSTGVRRAQHVANDVVGLAPRRRAPSPSAPWAGWHPRSVLRYDRTSPAGPGKVSEVGAGGPRSLTAGTTAAWDLVYRALGYVAIDPTAWHDSEGRNWSFVRRLNLGLPGCVRLSGHDTTPRQWNVQRRSNPVGATTNLAFVPMNPGSCEREARSESGTCHGLDWSRHPDI